MKMLPGNINASSRSRKPAQSSSSIYVPPPLRKRKNSNDNKKNTSDLPQKPKLLDGRGISLHVSNASSRCTNNKKCENSYMLFGLEDKSCISTSKHNEKAPQKTSEVESRENCALKESTSVKKCDNSYLLFSSDNSDFNKSDQSFCSNKIVNDVFPKKAMSFLRSEPNDPLKLSSSKKVSINEETCPKSTCNDHFDSFIGPNLPEELSCELDSLSVGNSSKSSKLVNSPTQKPSKETLKSLKQSSQKKCDNSSILFDYDYPETTNFKVFPQKKSETESGLSTSIPLGSCEVKTTASDSSQFLKTSNLNNSLVISSDVLLDRQGKINESSEKPLDGSVAMNSSFDVSESIEDYVVEIYDFPKTMRTQDLMTIFSSYVQDGFIIKWVDDTHALGIFSNPFSVSDVLKKKYDLVSVRSLQNASPASIDIAALMPVPSASRPRTCPSLARRLVSGALGLKVLVSDEIKQAEKKILQDAKEERRLAAKQREEAWEGTLRSSMGT